MNELMRLTRQDVGYLRREGPSQPMHFVFLLHAGPGADGRPVTLDDVRAHVAGRLSATPELRHKIREPLAGIGPVVWVDAADFDLQRHVVAWDVTADGDDAVMRAYEEVTTAQLDRSRPLWEVRVAPPQPDGRTPVTLAFHHALMDGGLVRRVLDALFSPGAAQPARPEWQPAHGPSRLRLLGIGVAERLAARWRGRTGGLRAPSPPPVPAPGSPAGQLRLSGVVGPRRAVAAMSVPLETVRQIGKARGVTVNDVYLAAVTHGVAAWQAARGASPGDTLVALVPRDVRSDEDARAMGNRTQTMVIPLPLSTAHDPLHALAQIRDVTTAAKADERSAGNVGFQFDIAISNVRLGGPHEIAGAPVSEYLVTAPLQGENRLLTVGLSYNDDFTITFTADADQFADVEVMAAHTRDAFTLMTHQPGPGG